MTQKFEIGLHTVIILVGPRQSGKSTWASIIQEKIKSIDKNLRCPIVYFNDSQHELFDLDYHYDQKMNEKHVQAYNLLKDRLSEHMVYPVNNEFIIVDTTGMDSQFRTEVAQMAREQEYRVGVVLFDYQTSHYFKDIDFGQDDAVFAKHVDFFKKKVVPNIKRKDFDYSFSVKEKSEKFYKELDVYISDYQLWKECHIDSSKDVVFIGDIHEHVDALIEMKEKIPKEAQVILLGDYLDKGEKTAEIIPIVEDMVVAGAKVIMANHESYVGRRLKGEIYAANKEEENFSSLKYLMADKSLAQRFLAIYDQSIPFAFYKNEKVSAYATHAPCRNKFLGKMSNSAKKEQRNFHFKSRDLENMNKELSFVNNESNDSHPLHVFGHVAHCMTELENKNKIWLDTGAVYGNKLSALIVKSSGDIKYIQVPTIKLDSSILFRFIKKEEQNISDVIIESVKKRKGIK